MSYIPHDFSDFIHKFMDNWRSMDIRIIAWKTEIGWLFHQIKIVLDSEPVTKPSLEDIPQIDSLLVIHERWDINELKQLLDSLENAELKIGGETIHVKTWNGQEWKCLANLNYRYHDKDIPLHKYDINYMSCSLEGYSSRQINYNEKELINHKLRTYKHPWDGLEDLRTNFIGLNKQWSSSDNSNITIIAPVFLNIKDIQFDNNEISVYIEKSDMIKFDEVLLSIISHYEDNEISRINRRITQNKTIVKLNKTPIKSKIMLNYRKHVPDSKEIYGYTSNQRIKAYQELSGEIQDFLSDVTESDKRGLARVFEAKIALLFHLIGFSPAHYGYGTNEVPDILVFDKNNRFVLVVECTLRQPDVNNKLTKLATRTDMIVQTITDIQVIPVLITALSRDRINKSDVEKAKTESIAIITNNEFNSLITMGLEQTSTDEIFDYIKTLIPSQYSI